MLKTLDYFEYFVFEKMMRTLFTYFIKHYNSMNSSPFESYLGFFPFPGVESLIIIASSNCLEFKSNKNMFKILHHLIYKPMYNFDCENKENFFALCYFFEKNLLERHNELYIHLRLLGIYPVNYVAKWISKLFTDHLAHD